MADILKTITKMLLCSAEVEQQRVSVKAQCGKVQGIQLKTNKCT